MSFVLWIKVLVKLRLGKGEKLSVDSPLLVREKKGKLVPMTADFIARKGKGYSPIQGWTKATIHSR